jgi:EpsI family protein
MTPRRPEAIISNAKLSDIVPRQVADWTSQPSSALVVPETGEPTNVYDQVLTRSYFAPGEPDVMLLIAYGAAQSGLMKVHRPEVCYASSGFTVGRVSSADIHLGAQTVAAETFAARRQDRSEQVLYWTRVSNAFPRNLTAERLLVLERGVQGLIPDGVLVRASVLNVGPTAVASLQRFMTALVSTAAGKGRTLLVGRDG